MHRFWKYALRKIAGKEDDLPAALWLTQGRQDGWWLFDLMNVVFGYAKEVNSAPGFILTVLGLLFDCPLPYSHAAIDWFSRDSY